MFDGIRKSSSACPVSSSTLADQGLQVFMTRRDALICVHEPFGDAFYFGTERLSDRYENDEEARQASGFGASSYKTIFERFDEESKQVRSPSCH